MKNLPESKTNKALSKRRHEYDITMFELNSKRASLLTRISKERMQPTNLSKYKELEVQHKTLLLQILCQTI